MLGHQQGWRRRTQKRVLGVAEGEGSERKSGVERGMGKGARDRLSREKSILSGNGDSGVRRL